MRFIDRYFICWLWTIVIDTIKQIDEKWWEILLVALIFSGLWQFANFVIYDSWKKARNK